MREWEAWDDQEGVGAPGEVPPRDLDSQASYLIKRNHFLNWDFEVTRVSARPTVWPFRNVLSCFLLMSKIAPVQGFAVPVNDVPGPTVTMATAVQAAPGKGVRGRGVQYTCTRRELCIDAGLGVRM